MHGRERLVEPLGDDGQSVAHALIERKAPGLRPLLLLHDRPLMSAAPPGAPQIAASQFPEKRKERAADARDA